MSRVNWGKEAESFLARESDASLISIIADMNEADLAREIKVFRKQFKLEHGRDPSRKDMNKYPAIAATYDQWLALKKQAAGPSSSRADTVSSSPTHSRKATSKKHITSTDDLRSPLKKRKEGPASPLQRFENGHRGISSMAPPPTTPSKRVKHSTVLGPIDKSVGPALLVTPTKKVALSPAASGSRGASIHDSGGSVVDVPSTPRRESASPSLLRRKQGGIVDGAAPGSPSISRYEDGSSPSKLRALLSSFSSSDRHSQTTPTKAALGTINLGNGADKELMERLTKGSRTTIPAFTPRTKARKRLRGEMVITPQKENDRHTSSHHSDVEAVNNGVKPAQKKQRGMGAGTLHHFGIVSTSSSRGASTSRTTTNKQTPGGSRQTSYVRFEEDNSVLDRGRKGHTRGTEADEEEISSEEEDMLGPSPSTNRVVNRSVQSFQPLFGVTSNGHLSGEEEVEAADISEEPFVEDHVPFENSEQDIGDRSDSDEDDIYIRPYQRYEDSQRLSPAAQLSDEGDDSVHVGIAARRADPSSPDMDCASEEEDDDDDEAGLQALSLTSPQGKRVLHRTRVNAQKALRHLLGSEKEMESFEMEKEGDRSDHPDEGDVTRKATSKTNKVGLPVKAGRLQKGRRKADESIVAEPVKKTIAADVARKGRLVFQNTREQLGSDEDSDVERGLGGDRDGDEWASEASSNEYGLGDGYMSGADDVL